MDWYGHQMVDSLLTTEGYHSGPDGVGRSVTVYLYAIPSNSCNVELSQGRRDGIIMLKTNYLNLDLGLGSRFNGGGAFWWLP
jgi:hypothetical protein